MILLANFAGVPLFSTIQEALDWAAANGLDGYHVHNFQGQTGYMGGVNHQQATGIPLNANEPQTTTTNTSSTPQQPAVVITNNSTSGGGGGY
tara:strand:+ start:859 stop:1134 length:276 start_codon:yes stop_codon:yes gene_type:complete